MDALAFVLDAVAPALASALFHSLWQNTLLALAAALALGALARAGAALRHSVALAFLLAMVALPAVQFLRFLKLGGSPIEAPLLAVTAAPFGAAANVFAHDSAPIAPAVLLLWLTGVTRMLLRQSRGLRAVATLERRPGRCLPPAWQRRAEELCRTLGIAGAVSVRLSEDVLVPCAARWLRPVVWLPLSLLTTAPAGQLQALLAHELAHIARRDWLWNRVQAVAEALLCFHPAAWWLGRRIRREREHACDDLAVAACGDALALAEALAALESGRRLAPRHVAARHRASRHAAPRLVLAASGGALVQRIARLLSGPAPRGRTETRVLLGVLTAVCLLWLTQIGVAAGRWPELQVRSSTAGELGPGDFREIIANSSGKLRSYRASLDEEGLLTESYRENGRPHAIDTEVREWLAGIERLSVELPRQEPPDMRAAAVGEAHLEAARAFDALVALVVAHPEVAARLGAPVAATSAPVNGNLRLQDAVGEADVRLEVRGPAGVAVVSVKAEWAEHRWTLRSLRLP